MVLYLIGLGLGDARDITLRGLEIVKNCDYVYLESYTNVFGATTDQMSKLYDKKIIAADREQVEQKADEILEQAKKKDVAFLIMGDVFAATTHIDLWMRAKKMQVDVKIVHNASVITAVAETGLDLYKFGKTTSIPFQFEYIRSPVDVFESNYEHGMHTLFLLDLDPEKGKYITVDIAAKYLLGKGVKDLMAVACAALGTEKSKIVYKKLSAIKKIAVYPQCLIIPGNLHFMEEEALKQWA